MSEQGNVDPMEMEMEITQETITEQSIEETVDAETLTEEEEITEETIDNGMELVMDGDKMEEMESIVEEKVKDSQEKAKSESRKRGPKAGKDKDKETDANESKTADASSPKESPSDLKNIRIMEREIKKGKVISPLGRIEKNAENRYDLLLVSELSAYSPKVKYEKVGETDKLVDGKWELSVIAADKFGDRFKLKLDGTALAVEGEESVSHEFVRVELHKPGRDKDVVEIYSIKDSRSKSKNATVKSEKDKMKEESEKVIS
jgi:hypothetical protein